MVRLLALAFAVLSITTNAFASPRLVEGNSSPPLPAWVPFCEQHEAECAIDPAEPAMIVLTPDTEALLAAVNRHVNENTRKVTDLEHVGVEDRWEFPLDGAGDCEDLQLLKRKMLVEVGLPRRALRMTVVIDRQGAGHALLTAITSEGDFVLDNLTNDVVAWADSGYVFQKRESQAGKGWAWLERPKVVVAGTDVLDRSR